MPKVTLSGRILHSGLDITINNLPHFEWPDDALGLTMSFQTTIIVNVVTVECTLNKFDSVEHLSAIYNRAYDIARGAVDLVAFKTGIGLIVVLDTVTEPDGKPEKFIARDMSLAALSTSIVLEEFGKSFEAVMSEPTAFFALRDLIEAITIPHRQPVNCARVVEAIRVTFVPDGSKKKKGWAEMQKSLHLSESYLMPITKAAEGHRHGDYHYIDGATTLDITRRAWIVMNRYIEYRKRGKQDLPLSDFPLLA